jgi:hypothetical protein
LQGLHYESGMKKALLGLATVLSIAACSSAHDAAGEKPNLTVTISGEGAALTGFAFPPSSTDELAFVDGWDVKFERILVTVDDIVLSDGPDTNPTDQAQTGGAVATAKGPWAVDMTKPGAVTNIKPQSVNADRDSHAQLLARFDSLDGNKAFDTANRYAFGFDIVPAAAAAQHTNLDGAADLDYAEMVAKGISVLYVGTATFKGTDCKSSDPTYDFTQLPKQVRFRFGFKSPSTYKNCQNTDLRGKAFDGEEHQRGVQMSDHGETNAQITLHVDHPFWNTVDHDAAELFFDQMAAASKDGLLTLDDLAGVDFTNFKMPWRSCITDKPVKQGIRSFDSGNVPFDRNGAPSAALRSYADYVTYEQSTQGHLNADGLCAVQRHFDSPR